MRRCIRRMCGMCWRCILSILKQSWLFLNVRQNLEEGSLYPGPEEAGIREEHRTQLCAC